MKRQLQYRGYAWNIKSLNELKESTLLQNATERALQVAV